MDQNRKKLLHVGCGRQSTEVLPPLDFEHEWQEIRLDIDPKVKPDIVASIVDLVGVADNSIDMIFSKHNLEHLWAHEVPLCLAAFMRVLKPTGAAVIRVPNLAFIAEQILKSGPERTLYNAEISGQQVPISALDMLFGWGTAIADGNTYMAHKTGFTHQTLCRHLLNAGFERATPTIMLGGSEIGVKAAKVVAGNIIFELSSGTDTPS